MDVIIHPSSHPYAGLVNTLRPRQNGRHFADEILKYIFLDENVWIAIDISLRIVPKGSINNFPSLVQIMAWRRPGDKPLSEPMMVRLPTHICVTRRQWVNFCQLKGLIKCIKSYFYGLQIHFAGRLFHVPSSFNLKCKQESLHVMIIETRSKKRLVSNFVGGKHYWNVLRLVIGSISSRCS